VFRPLRSSSYISVQNGCEMGPTPALRPHFPERRTRATIVPDFVSELRESKVGTDLIMFHSCHVSGRSATRKCGFRRIDGLFSRRPEDKSEGDLQMRNRILLLLLAAAAVPAGGPVDDPACRRRPRRSGQAVRAKQIGRQRPILRDAYKVQGSPRTTTIHRVALRTAEIPEW
jgi:hypothetical protein